MTTTAVRIKKRLSAEEWLRDLGDVPPHRIRMIPYPGTATEADAVRVSETECLCELVNGTLVEKVMGTPESSLAFILIGWLAPYLRQNPIGMGHSPDGMFRMLHGNIREPDVAFTRRDRMPNPLPQVGGWCPDLCVEILSPDNTRAEMAIKRKEYFDSGCQLDWEIDPRKKTATVFTADDAGTQTNTLEGGTVLPGFALPLAQLFAEYDAAMPPAAP